MRTTAKSKWQGEARKNDLVMNVKTARTENDVSNPVSK